jgi:peptide-methionine (R)-S-oxide reductase
MPEPTPSERRDNDVTRRELIGMGSVGIVAIAVASRFALMDTGAKADESGFPVTHSDAQWRAMLAPASYAVLRKAGTERPFSSPLLAEHRKGIFSCGGCRKPLFDARTKFDSHTGWPSFWDVLPKAIARREDRSLAMVRTEVHCADCGGHLGHLFKDGPPPTGLRYCMNGVAMIFMPATA